MNKAELIKALEPYPDDADIVLWRWNDTGDLRYPQGGSFQHLNQVCTNAPELPNGRWASIEEGGQLKHPKYFGLSLAIGCFLEEEGPAGDNVRLFQEKMTILFRKGEKNE